MATSKKTVIPPALKSMVVPPWLEYLLSIVFFLPCEVHTEASRNESKMFCMDCGNEASCSQCIDSFHRGHRVLQVRRSSYHDVVRISEIEGAVDLSAIQTYVINGSRVVFLNTRYPTNHSNKIGGRMTSKHNNKCLTCARNLIDLCHFCSLECKFEWTKKEDDESSGAGNGNVRSSEEEEEDVTSNLTQVAAPPPRDISYNSRKRKGIPRRAPLF